MSGNIGFAFLGKHENRWRIKVDLDFSPEALTVGLVSEDGRCLGPAMVVPPGGPDFLLELSGPCQLPTGALVRCVVDTTCGSWMQEFPVDARRGLHAFLHADGRLPVDSSAEGVGLERGEIRRLARVLPWLGGPRKKESKGWEPAAAPQEPSPSPTGCPDDLLQMLKEDFGVEVDEMEEDFLESLRR